jgi:hypothetical protein
LEGHNVETKEESVKPDMTAVSDTHSFRLKRRKKIENPKGSEEALRPQNLWRENGVDG